MLREILIIILIIVLIAYFFLIPREIKKSNKNVISLMVKDPEELDRANDCFSKGLMENFGIWRAAMIAGGSVSSVQLPGVIVLASECGIKSDNPPTPTPDNPDNPTPPQPEPQPDNPPTPQPQPDQPNDIVSAMRAFY